MKNYDSKWVLVRTKYGPVEVEEKMLQSIEKCREAGVPLVVLTFSVFYDAFRFAWASPPEPTRKEMQRMFAVTTGVKIGTMNDPDAGRESDMAYEKKMEEGGEEQLAVMRREAEAMGFSVLS